MEEARTVRTWFDTMNEAAPSEEKERLFATYFAPTLASLSEDDVTDAVLETVLETVGESGATREEALAAVSLLRSLLSFISRETGKTMPLPRLRTDFFRRPGIPEGNAFLLNEALTASTERHAAAFWLLLHTELPLATVLRLRARDVELRERNLILTYDRRARVPKEEGTVDPKFIKSAVLSPEEASLRFWERLLALTGDDGENYLVSGNGQPERRRALEVSLNLFAGKCGLCKLTLRELSETEWNWDEATETEANFTTEIPETFDAPAEGTEKPTYTLSAKKLKDAQKVFPVPVSEHCRRTVQIAGFLLEHLRTADWFLDKELDADLFAVAIYFHDLGKTRLTLDDYYADAKSAAEQNNRYRSHVDQGVSLLGEIAGAAPETFAADSLPGMIRDAIADHHERVDGKGFPQGKRGEEISLVGRVCAIADTVDRRLFFTDVPDKDPAEVVDRVLAGAGTRFDARLIAILAENRNLFLSFLGELNTVFRHQRTEDAYGMRFGFRPYANSEGEFSLAEAHLYFNDPYYGLLDSDKILPVVEDHPRYSLFTKLEIKRLCRLIGSANEERRPLPLVCVRVSVQEVMKNTFFSTVFRIFVDCGIHYHQLMFTLDEADVINNGADIADLAEKFHVIGALMAISEFGGETTLLPSLSRIRPDAIILQRKYANCSGNALGLDFVELTLQSARKIGFDVYCPGVQEKKQYTFLSKAGIRFFGGSYVGGERSETEFSGGEAAAHHEN